MIIEYASTFKFFDTSKFISNTRFFNVSSMMEEENFIHTLNEIATVIVRDKFDIVIIDPITVFADYLEQKLYRIVLDEFLSKMRMSGTLTMMTGEMQQERQLAISIEAYLSDGIIILSNQLEATYRRRYLEVVKMRGTCHSNTLHPFLITDSGFSVS